MLQAVEPILARAANAGVTPGGVLAVADRGQPAVVIPFGETGGAPDLESRPVDAGTVYDIASLTKPVATSALLMQLVAEGRVALDSPARTLVPELTAPGTESITLAHLAGHAAGFPDHVEFFRQLRHRPGGATGGRAGAASAREALVQMAGATELAAAPGQLARYSDVGYILLGAAVERAAGQRLDQAARERVFAPLGMTATGYAPLDAPGTGPVGTVAPTERCDHRGLLVGEVHDENAHAAGGVCGHAGLFATAGDLARFAAAMCAAVAGTGDPGPLPPDVARRFASTPSAPGTTWRLGWDTPSTGAGVSQAGDLWPRDGIGHLGFTGCSMWLGAGAAALRGASDQPGPSQPPAGRRRHSPAPPRGHGRGGAAARRP